MRLAKQYPAVGRLWLTRLLTAHADGIGRFAIQWLATLFPNAAVAVAYANTLGSIASTISSYIAGWLSDRVAPVLLMIIGNVAGAVFTIAIGLMLDHARSFAGLLILVILWNVFTVMTSAASRTIVPRTVAAGDLPHVNAWMGIIGPIQQFVAKGLAGVLIATGVFHAFLAAGIVLLVSVLPLLGNRSFPAISERSGKRPHIFSGFRVVWSNSGLRSMVIYTSVQNFGFSFFLGEYVLYLKASAGLSAAQIGLGLSIATVGTVASLFLGPKLLTRQMKWVIVVSPVLIAAGIAVVSMWGGMVGLIVGLLLLEGGSGLANQTVALIRQRIVPLDSMGAASGSLMLFHSILVPLAMALAGVIAVRYGPGVTMQIAWITVLLSTLLAVSLARRISP